MWFWKDYLTMKLTQTEIENRIDHLLKELDSDTSNGYELGKGTLGLIVILYGANSPQVKLFTKELEKLPPKEKSIFENDWTTDTRHTDMLRGTLNNLRAEIQIGLIDGLQKTLTGEILTDFLKLARTALKEKGEDAKNVAAVLSAALYEDTIRRLATLNGITHREKLATVLNELKNQNILQGSQVGIAQSYLNFRNNSLHADWNKVDRPEIQSVLAFTEELILKYFS